MVAERIIVVSKPVAPPVVPAPGDAPPPGSAMAEALARRALAWSEHRRSLAGVREVLEARGLAVVEVELPELLLWGRLSSLPRADLVVTVGGDGTFLAAASAVREQAMLGVNSSPSTSTGRYCGSTLATFAAALDAIVEGAAPTPLVRIQIAVEGTSLPALALNDVLFANRSPPCSSRYALTVGETVELQLSSGIWIATASGSSAAIRSAGGEPMGHGDPRLQLLVREPYQLAHAPSTLLRALTEEPIRVMSRHDDNALFLDGQPHPWPVPFGAQAVLAPADRPLLVHGYRV